MLKKKIVRFISGLLVMSVVMGIICPVQIALAAEEKNIELAEGDKEETGSVGAENGQVDAIQSEEQTSQDQTEEISQSDEKTEQLEGTKDNSYDVSTETDIKTNQQETHTDIQEKETAINEDLTCQVEYVYVESPVLSTPGTQKIVFALDDMVETEEMWLNIKKSDGSIQRWYLSEWLDDLYLFEKNFDDESQTGTYEAVSMEAQTDGGLLSLNLSDAGIDVRFGVNEEYDGVEELLPVDGNSDVSQAEVEATIVSLDSGETQKAEEGIAAALSAAGATVSTLASNDLARTSAKSSNIVVALDPGHDSTHAGAQGSGLKEEILTLKIANYCKEELEKYAGVTVYMTRTEASCPYPGTKSSADDIAKRADAAAEAGAQIFVSFHLNSSVASGASGAEVIIPNKNWKPDVAEEGKQLAEKIMDELTKLGLKERDIYSKSASEDKNPDGSAADYFAVQRANKENGIPGIIIEHAFISNSSDVNNYLNTEAGLKKLGVADATGIAEYLGLEKGKWIQDSKGWRYQKEDGTYAINTFLAVGGGTYYFDKDGYRVTGWQTINESKYYFNADGTMFTGWAFFGKEKYYFSADGKMFTGWASFGDAQYYFFSDGRMATGWQNISNKRYYFSTEGVLQTGWKTINGKTYYLNANNGGAAQTGWASFGNKKFYFGTDGAVYTGKQTIDGVEYVFDSEGVLQEQNSKDGWVENKGKRYYYKDGKVLTGWQTINGKTYYLNANNGGAAQTGWASFGSVRYYFNTDGSVYTGWFEQNGKRYYLNANNGGAAQVGWASFGSVRYYFNTDGSVYTGWFEQNGKRYYLNANNGGAAQTGWASFGSQKFYFGTDGAVLTGWQTISGKTYYLNANNGGAAQTGWASFGSVRYYFNADGSVYTGWLVQNGKKYYLNGNNGGTAQMGWASFGSQKFYFGTDGAVLTGKQTIDGVEYEFDSDGVLQSGKNGWVEQDGYRFYYKDGKLLTGWQTISGKTYYLNANNGGAAQTGWASFGSVRYYFSSDGSVYTGWLEQNGKRYYLNADNGGVAQTGWASFGSQKFYFGTDGAVLTGWQTISGKTYYLNANNGGAAQTGWASFGSVRYYFSSDGSVYTGWLEYSGKKYYLNANNGGAAQTGWASFGSQKYYFSSTGEAQTGWTKIDGTWYYFDAEGVLDTTPSTKSPDNPQYVITGKSTVTAQQMADYYVKVKKQKYPSFYKDSDAKTIEEFCAIYCEEAAKEGIRAEVAFVQAMLETNWLKFTGDVSIEQNNFAGIGTTGGGVAGASFADVRTGVRAQIQHLKAYANTQNLNNPVVDPRFNLVTRGSAPYVEWLGIKENPYGKGWAAGKNYGYNLIRLLNELGVNK